MTHASSDPRVLRTQSKVLAAARLLLQEGGIAAVTVDSVVARSGVAKTSVYRHWPSRSDLVIELFSSLVPRLPPLDTTASLKDQLTALLVTFAQQLEDGPWAAALPALIAAADRDSDLADVRRQVREQAQTPFVALIEAHPHELAPMNSRDGAAQLFGPLIHRRLIDTGPIDAALVEQVVTCFLACHRAVTSQDKPARKRRSATRSA